eukprot:scaffold2210_cov316-Pinguiococcus_pyrenoidosus.AAC.2
MLKAKARHASQAPRRQEVVAGRGSKHVSLAASKTLDGHEGNAGVQLATHLLKRVVELGRLKVHADAVVAIESHALLATPIKRRRTHRVRHSRSWIQRKGFSRPIRIGACRVAHAAVQRCFDLALGREGFGGLGKPRWVRKGRFGRDFEKAPPPNAKATCDGFRRELSINYKMIKKI